jgi:FkbM family methyltransferase
MIAFDKWAFPDGETHLPARMRKWNLRVDGRLTYQYPLYSEALKRCATRDVAVDVGAHVGLFSYWMVRDFAELHAFEPVAAHRECWVANVPAREQDRLYPYALGAKPGSVRMATPAGSSGGTYVAGPGEIPMFMLDTFALPKVNLLKIDCEGYELEVLTGAAGTLGRCHPVVVVEQRPRMVARFKHGAADAVHYLRTLGAAVAWTDRKDYVLLWA